MPDLLGICEAAERLGLHRETLRQYAATGKIPALKVGSRWRFRSENLRQWLASQERAVARRRVLVVDDEHSVREPVRLLLKEAGYVVTAASTGEEALASLGETLPDAALLDLHLSGISGVEVLGELKERCPGMPVIIVTGYPDSEMMQRALEISPVMMMAKPVHPKRLLEAVAMVMGSAVQNAT